MASKGNNMREITLPDRATFRRAFQNSPGRWLAVPVKVDWPELQLTEEHVMANALADAVGAERPFPDHSYILVKIPLTWGVRQ